MKKMKKMKKIYAMILTLALVLGMSMTAMAETATTTTQPTAADIATATIINVKSKATVTAYQIIQADYGNNGFLGYEEVEAIANATDVDLVAGTYLTEAERDKITSTVVTGIAAKISAGTLTLPSEVFTAVDPTQEQTSFTADLNAGYWIVLVTDSVGVYNPMLIGVYYTVGGSDNTVSSGNAVDATSKWSLVTTGAYAKSSAPVIHKNSDATSYYVGETIKYKVSTIVPDYSDAYVTENIVYKIKDTVNNEELGIDVDTIKVSVSEGTLTKDTDYIIQTSTKSGYEVVFTGAWVTANPNKEITITYDAKLVGEIGSDASTTTPYNNEVVLTYTNAPGTTKKATAAESVYTYKIENKITKVGQGTDSKKLAGATFTIYTDSACTKKYTVNTNYHDGTVVSDENGYINIYGLDIGTYYIKETIAPAGYTVNNSVFTIVVSASETKNYDEADEVKDISVKIDAAETATIPNTKILSLPSTGGIGTTIFTVVGCAIMIVAAAMFLASRRKEVK